MRYTTAKEFFNPVRFVRGGNLIDLDWLLDSTSSQMPLAMDTAARLFDSGKEFWMCASRGDDYTPGYFSPQKRTGWISFAPPAPFPVSIVPAHCWTASAIWTAASVTLCRYRKLRDAGQTPLW